MMEERVSQLTEKLCVLSKNQHGSAPTLSTGDAIRRVRIVLDLQDRGRREHESCVL